MADLLDGFGITGFDGGTVVGKKHGKVVFIVADGVAVFKGDTELLCGLCHAGGFIYTPYGAVDISTVDMGGNIIGGGVDPIGKGSGHLRSAFKDHTELGQIGDPFCLFTVDIGAFRLERGPDQKLTICSVEVETGTVIVMCPFQEGDKLFGREGVTEVCSAVHIHSRAAVSGDEQVGAEIPFLHLFQRRLGGSAAA